MSSKRKMRRRSPASAQLLEIVYGPMEQAWHAQLPRETREAMPGLHALVLDDPRAAVAELRTWIEREPIPMFFNWLSAAYSALGDMAALEDVIRENYQRNPQYLFARLNYAELCLRDGNLAGAREALGAGFDIRPLLGGRKRIHVSELTGYYYAVGLYHVEAGNRDAAEKLYELLKDAAPGERPTEELRRKLHPRLWDLFSRQRLRQMPQRTGLQSILILGSGPIVIGQAAEFDYSGTQAVRALREEGYRVILVNSNPATITMDPDLADATYVEPITP